MVASVPSPPFDVANVAPSAVALARVPRTVAIANRVLPLNLYVDDDGQEVLHVAAAQARRLEQAQTHLKARPGDQVVYLAGGRPPAAPGDREAEELLLSVRLYSQCDRLVFEQVEPTALQAKILDTYGPEPTPDPDHHVVFADNLLRDLVYRRFTDLESEPTGRGGVLRGMVDQEWIEVHSFDDRENYDRFIRVIKSKAAGPHLNAGTMNAPQDGQLHMVLPHRSVDVRVSVMPMRGRESIWLRFHELEMDLASPERLGMPPDVIAALDQAFQLVDPENVADQALAQPRGVIVWTGPQRTGKTTTAEAYAVHRLVPRGIRCAIVANPTERVIEGLAQFEVNDRSGMSFAAIARALKRRRYGFTFTAEGRDKESIHAAFSDGGTGGLAGLTFHAPDCVGACEKFKEYDVPVTLQAENIKLFLSQRLVRRLCGDCKVAVQAPDVLVSARGSARGCTVYRAGGCRICNGTGYRRELAVFEKLRPTPDFWQALRDGALSAQLYEIALRAGFRPMFEHGIDRILAGETSVDEVFRKVPQPR